MPDHSTFSKTRHGRLRESDLLRELFKTALRRCPAREIPRSIHEGARDMARDIARTEAYATSRRQRKKVEMLFAHL